MNTTKVRYAAALVLLAAGCSGDKVDIGDPEVAITGEELADYASRWEGYAEAHRFSDGSDSIRLSIDENGQGVLVVGNAEPPALSTDPDVPNDPRSPDSLIVPGFAYPMHGVEVRDARIRFDARSGDVMEPWCAMQTPYEDSMDPGSYACLPLRGVQVSYDEASLRSCTLIDEQTNPLGQINCSKYDACTSGTCGCSETECHSQAGILYELDAALTDNGEQLVGTFLTRMSALHATGFAVRFQRID